MGRRRKRGRATPVDLLDAHADFEIDLHGHTVESALRRVANDLATYRRRKAGAVVHVITGKGRNSEGSVSRLQPAVGDALKGKFKPLIEDFCRDYDEGGFKVRLK